MRTERKGVVFIYYTASVGGRFQVTREVIGRRSGFEIARIYAASFFVRKPVLRETILTNLEKIRRVRK